ncbi:MAG: hypothetical protein J5723_01865 [Ruminococcus sp.]|nr:hypothetical protein [Ruminococcus sp.]
MNRNMRLVVSVLFIVIIVLAVAITRFYSKSEKSAYNDDSQPVIEDVIDTRDGNHIFKDNKGLFGILDSSNRVIVYPEWQELNYAGGNGCIASKRFDSKRLYGCIDYEGNITVPFVYSEIVLTKVRGVQLLIAKTADTGSYSIYYDDFRPCFSETWKSCSADTNKLTLRTDMGIYTFSTENSELLFTKATITGFVGDHVPYNFEITDEHLLETLTPKLIEIIFSDTSGYLDYAYSKGRTVPDDKLNPRYKKYSAVFPDEKNIEVKITDLSELQISGFNSNDAAITVNVVLYVGTDVKYQVNGSPQTIHGNYRVTLSFSGSFETDFGISYAKFQRSKPKYPRIVSDETQENSEQAE